MLIAAAVILVLLSGFHSILGERLILQPIRRADNLPKIWGRRDATFRTIQVTWHLVSILWLGLAGYLLILHVYPAHAEKGLLIIFGLIFAVLAVMPFLMRVGKHKSWIAFGLLALLLLGHAFYA